MDGQTEGQTDRFDISISRVSVLTRDKKSDMWPIEFCNISLKLCLVPFEIFSNGVTLKIGVRVVLTSRTLKMAPFDRS